MINYLFLSAGIIKCVTLIKRTETTVYIGPFRLVVRWSWTTLTQLFGMVDF